MSITLRVKGRLARLQGTIVDFNRHGAAVCIDQPIKKDKQVFASIRCRGEVTHEVVGVVHNCVALDEGYRCGIRFRPESALQFDQEAVLTQLLALEQALSA